MKYKFLEEVAIADVAFESYGKTLRELFTNTAEALYETMAETKTVEPLEKRTISLRNKDIEKLLYDFLSEIVFLKDRDSIVFRESDLEVTKIDDEYMLSATLYCQPIDAEIQTLRADVKAVTMHMFKIEKSEDGYKATVVVDV